MDLVNIIEDELKIKAEIEYRPMQPGDVKETYADITETTKRLNYKPRTSIIEGIPKFINWFREYYD